MSADEAAECAAKRMPTANPAAAPKRSPVASGSAKHSHTQDKGAASAPPQQKSDASVPPQPAPKIADRSSQKHSPTRRRKGPSGTDAKESPPAKQQALAAGPSSPPIHYAEAPADHNLPPPWQEHVSTSTGKPFWYNPESKERTWICPQSPRRITSPKVFSPEPLRSLPGRQEKRK